MRSPRAAMRFVASIALALPVFFQAGVAGADAGLIEMIARVKPSIVALGTFQKSRNPAFVFRGTGFAVGDGTLIATAAHVVVEDLQTDDREIMMALVQVPGIKEPQGREAKAVAVDKFHDVALLRITGAPLPVVTLGDSNTVRDGESVAFTGFPIGSSLGFRPVTHRGIIASSTPIALPGNSAAKLDGPAIRSLKAGPLVVFQLDATAYPGHSGSPLYDVASGEVIGVVNMRFLSGAKDGPAGQPSGISFAVPIRHLQELIRGSR